MTADETEQLLRRAIQLQEEIRLCQEALQGLTLVLLQLDQLSDKIDVNILRKPTNPSLQKQRAHGQLLGSQQEQLLHKLS